MNVAERFNAIPFDIEGVKFTHHGDFCSFDAMLGEFGLASSSSPLNILAKIIRGADTNRYDLASESAGLLAVSTGLSHMYDDDHEQLEVGMLIYDALYCWARDGDSEGND